MKLNQFIILVLGTMLFLQCSPKNKQINENQKMGKLVYIMDPQCGWCYGNKDNIFAIREKYKNELGFELMVGGMWIGENAPVGGQGLFQFMQTNGPRMSQTTGVPLGDAFYELSKDSTYVFSSLEPSAAVVLVKELAPEKAFRFAKEIQEALYAKGEKLDEWTTFESILNKMNLDTNSFKEKWLTADNIRKTELEFSACSNLVSGFPSLIYYDENNTAMLLASGYFNEEEMVAKINQLLE